MAEQDILEIIKPKSFDTLKPEELAKHIAQLMKERGIFEWIDNNWFLIMGPLFLAKKYSLFGLFWTWYGILKNYVEKEEM